MVDVSEFWGTHTLSPDTLYQGRIGLRRLWLQQRLGDTCREFVREYLSRRDVVAVGESTRHDEDAEFVEQVRVIRDPVDVDAFGVRAGDLERVLGFEIAVRTGRP